MKPSASILAQRCSTALPATDEPATRKNTPHTVLSAAGAVVLVFTALALSACNKAPLEPAAAVISSGPPATAPVTSPPSDTSVPDASAVLTPGVMPQAASSAARSNTTMSRAQESSQMPMAGQNNDHSAPLTPAKRASAP